MIEIRRILCPIDFSEYSRHALDHAVAMARWYDSTITLLHVCSVVPVAAYAPGTPILPSVVLTPADRDELLASMRRFAEDEAGSSPPIQLEFCEGSVVAEVLARAESMPGDLIVMGTHGRSGFERLVMGAVTASELRGTVLSPDRRGPAYIGKLGFDRTVRPDLRVRLTGSIYKADEATSNTLYSGDRAGSRFYYVLENTQATESTQFRSGLINPGFRNRVTALQSNPFVKFRGLEVFGVVERAKGGASAELMDRTWNQYATDVVYRFLPREQVYAGIRYNKVEGALRGVQNDVSVSRWELAAGWFATPHILVKGGYVTQVYEGFPPTDIRNGGKFNGVMMEGVVAF